LPAKLPGGRGSAPWNLGSFWCPVVGGRSTRAKGGSESWNLGKFDWFFYGAAYLRNRIRDAFLAGTPRDWRGVSRGLVEVTRCKVLLLSPDSLTTVRVEPENAIVDRCRVRNNRRFHRTVHQPQQIITGFPSFLVCTQTQATSLRKTRWLHCQFARFSGAASAVTMRRGCRSIRQAS